MKNKVPFIYKMLYFVTKLVVDFLYYRKTYYVNTKNIPSNGTPLIVVSNHQNSLNDALAILYSTDIRRLRFLARADVFKHPIASKVLYFFGLLPVFRQRDGMENVKNNLNVFAEIENLIIQGNSIALFPEAMHQDRHFLGRFYLSYTRLAFGAAERSGFEKEIFILPSANHYSDYYHIQEDVMQVYGTPISLKPYYELYKEQAREAQMQVNDIVRAQVDSLMLNIEDEENYEAIYFLLNTYGRKFARDQKVDPCKLPEKLKSDQKLVRLLKQVYAQNPAQLKELYAKALKYQKELNELKITDDMVERRVSFTQLISPVFAFILTFPLFVYGFLHHVIPYNIPKLLTRKIKDRLLHPSVFVGLNALILIPLLYIIYFIMCLVISKSLIIAFIYLVTLPLFARFALYYRKHFFYFMKKIRLYKYGKKCYEKLDRARHLRFDIFQSVDMLWQD